MTLRSALRPPMPRVARWGEPAPYGCNVTLPDAKQHPLYRFGSRMIAVAHGPEKELMEVASRIWEGYLTGSMTGELNAGIGAQGQSLTQSALTSGAGAMFDECAARYNEHQLKALDAKEAAGESLSQEETLERSDRRGAEYARLDQAQERGLLGLSEEETETYQAYQRDDQAARAKEQLMRVNAKIQAIKAEEKAIADAAIAKERAARREAARDQRDERKKPEPQPGTQRQREAQRHAGFAAGAGAGSGVSETSEGVDSMGVIHRLREQERVTEALTQMFTPEQLAPLAEQSRQDYWDQYRDPRKVAAARMEEWAAESPAVAALCAEDMIAHHQVDNSIHEAKGALIGLGVATFGAGMWAAPVATAVETGVAIAVDKLAEKAALASGYSPETASTIGTVAGLATPFATMGKVGALADATLTPALKQGMSKVMDGARRVELRVDPLRLGTAGGNVSLGLKPKAA
ncbi:MAG: hypothetical protein Q8Q56_00545, partial [Alphaproteobacteria bacterium]|nr:hypothetical protein [Alphaproteobacteria bacterium]